MSIPPSNEFGITNEGKPNPEFNIFLEKIKNVAEATHVTIEKLHTHKENHQQNLATLQDLHDRLSTLTEESHFAKLPTSIQKLIISFHSELQETLSQENSKTQDGPQTHELTKSLAASVQLQAGMLQTSGPDVLMPWELLESEIDAILNGQQGLSAGAIILLSGFISSLVSAVHNFSPGSGQPSRSQLSNALHNSLLTFFENVKGYKTQASLQYALYNLLQNPNNLLGGFSALIAQIMLNPSNDNSNNPNIPSPSSDPNNVNPANFPAYYGGGGASNTSSIFPPQAGNNLMGLLNDLDSLESTIRKKKHERIPYIIDSMNDNLSQIMAVITANPSANSTQAKALIADWKLQVNALSQNLTMPAALEEKCVQLLNAIKKYSH